MIVYLKIVIRVILTLLKVVFLSPPTVTQTVTQSSRIVEQRPLTAEELSSRPSQPSPVDHNAVSELAKHKLKALQII